MDSRNNTNKQYLPYHYGEELTQADLGDLKECISNRWVFSDEPRPLRLPWHENLAWADFHDLQILEGWADILRRDGMTI
jgi:hypothetical protein